MAQSVNIMRQVAALTTSISRADQGTRFRASVRITNKSATNTAYVTLAHTAPGTLTAANATAILSPGARREFRIDKSIGVYACTDADTADMLVEEADGDIEANLAVGLEDALTSETAARVAADGVLQAEIDLLTAGTSLLGQNFIWDPFFDYLPVGTFWEPIGAKTVTTRWTRTGTQAIVADTSNPYGTGLALAHSVTASNQQCSKRFSLAELGLKIGDVISAAANVYAVSGSSYLRIQARTSAGSAVSNQSSTTHAHSSDSTIHRVDNYTIPATTAFIDIGVYSSGAGTNTYNIWAMWANVGAASLTSPTRGWFDSYMRSCVEQQVVYKPVSATQFYVYSPYNGGWLRFSVDALDMSTLNGSGTWWTLGQIWNVGGLNDQGIGATPIGGTDIGDSMGLTPSGMSTQTVTNRHGYVAASSNSLYSVLETVALTLGSTAARVTPAITLRNIGTILHPDTGATDQGKMEYVLRWENTTPGAVKGKLKVKWLATVTVDYWNTGQAIHAQVDRAWPHRNGPTLSASGSGSDLAFTGTERGYSYRDTYHDIMYSYCPGGNLYVRDNTLKLYPRSLYGASRVNGDIDFAEYEIGFFRESGFSGGSVA